MRYTGSFEVYNRVVAISSTQHDELVKLILLRKLIYDPKHSKILAYTYAHGVVLHHVRENLRLHVIVCYTPLAPDTSCTSHTVHGGVVKRDVRVCRAFPGPALIRASS